MYKHTLKLIAASTMLASFTACNEHPKESSAKEQILSRHDDLMAKSERAMTIKMQLDTLRPDQYQTTENADTAKTRKEIVRIKDLLIKADDQMQDWMHQYQPDYSGDTPEATNAYYQKELKKIADMEDSFRYAINSSDTLFNRLHLKTGAAAKSSSPHKMSH